MLQFHEPVVRFGTSGTLILLYSIVDHAARRFGADPLRARPRSPRWLAALVFISVTAFYLCIKPTGGAIFGGAGNVAEILLCLFAMAARGGNAAGLAPALPSRALASEVVCMHKDRVLVEEASAGYRGRMASSARWIPGVS